MRTGAYREAALLDAAADHAQPIVRRLPGCVGLAPLLRGECTGSRIGAEEFHAGQAGMEITEAVRDDLVAHVARQVDDEAIVTERLLRGAGLQFRQVDVPCGELPENAVQAPR